MLSNFFPGGSVKGLLNFGNALDNTIKSSAGKKVSAPVLMKFPQADCKRKCEIFTLAAQNGAKIIASPAKLVNRRQMDDQQYLSG